MKRCLIVALLLMFMAGCSGFQARGEMAKLVDSSGLAAAALKVRLDAGTVGDPEARGQLDVNAGTLATYREAKTTNVFAYWFGGKTIFVTAKYAELLDRTALLADATQTKATTQPTAWVLSALGKECRVLVSIANAKAGKRDDQ